MNATRTAILAAGLYVAVNDELRHVRDCRDCQRRLVFRTGNANHVLRTGRDNRRLRATTTYYAPTTTYYAPMTTYYAPTTAYYAPTATYCVLLGAGDDRAEILGGQAGVRNFGARRESDRAKTRDGNRGA